MGAFLDGSLREPLSSLWGIDHEQIPALLLQLGAAAPMQRLKNVGMNCGCEYTAFPCFQRLRPYSRFTHSLGVGLIVWHFTGEEKQAAAGLLHDIATPTFAHVVDFLRGDYLVQEATEDGTRGIIEADASLQTVLQSRALTTEEVCDYHRYPIADNDAPRLSADRLEYTLGNLLNFGLGDLAEAAEYYRDLQVTQNEQGKPELGFVHEDTALRFSEKALLCSKIYVSDEDRYAMQILSELLRDAIRAGVLEEPDLMTDEPRLLEKLCRTQVWRARWEDYRGMKELERSELSLGEDWRCIDAKRRCIDPLVIGQGRVSECFPDFGRRLQDFRTMRLSCWLRAKTGARA